jgi:DNA polymerase I-like protein with 3'-5' exonuclease and polymerase domains
MFPGGMSDTTFLNNQRKTGNIEMTPAEATELRTAWFDAFPEMDKHMQPTREGNSDRYIATNIFGMTRRNCSFNSACNLQFQSIAAIGAKYAGWKLYRAKMPIVNFVHDEYIFEFPIEEAADMAVVAADIQVKAMKEILPHVLIKAEPALMYVWDKEAEPVWSPTGRLEVWRPKPKEVK